MQKIKACIVEDEIGARNSLTQILEEYISDVEVVGYAGEVQEAISLIENQQPDVVFMDISLTDGNGFQVLDATKSIPYEVIFTTAHNQYREMAFD